MVSGLICFYLTVYLGRFFFAVKTVGDDGSIQASVDPVRAAIFHAVLFLIVLFAGGFWVSPFHDKNRSSSFGRNCIGHLSADCFRTSYCAGYSTFSEYFVCLYSGVEECASSILMRLTDSLAMSAIISSFAPLLFILFGRAEK